MKRKVKRDPPVGYLSISQSPNTHPKPKKSPLMAKDRHKMPLYDKVEHFTGDFLKRKQSAWVEMECAICRKDFMSRRTSHRVACSRKCVGKVSAMANLAKKLLEKGGNK